MCGIAGLIAPYSSAKWKSRMMDRLLFYAQVRGDDATGIAFIDQKRGLVVVKDGKPAKEFINSHKGYLEEKDSLPAIVIGHARSATKRTATGPEDNANNHPFIGPDARIAMIHNGLISDDEKWRKTVGQEGGLKNKPKSPVDSEVMCLAVETFYLNQPKEKRSLANAIDDAAYCISGSYTLAFVKEDEPNRVWFVRHNNPLSFALIRSQNAILFGSTDKILEAALSEYKEHFNFFVETTQVPAIINDALEEHMVSIEITGDEKKPFLINTRKLDCAPSDMRARQYIQPEPKEQEAVD